MPYKYLKRIMENKVQLVHYGKLLKMSMAEKGTTNIHIMNLLGIKAYETLNARFEDGAFTYEQLKVLTEKGLL